MYDTSSPKDERCPPHRLWVRRYMDNDANAIKQIGVRLMFGKCALLRPQSSSNKRDKRTREFLEEKGLTRGPDTCTPEVKPRHRTLNIPTRGLLRNWGFGRLLNTLRRELAFLTDFLWRHIIFWPRWSHRRGEGRKWWPVASVATSFG